MTVSISKGLTFLGCNPGVKQQSQALTLIEPGLHFVNLLISIKKALKQKTPAFCFKYQAMEQ